MKHSTTINLILTFGVVLTALVLILINDKGLYAGGLIGFAIIILMELWFKEEKEK